MCIEKSWLNHQNCRLRARLRLQKCESDGLVAAMPTSPSEACSLRRRCGAPVESTHGLVESTHGLVESTHGLVESTHGLVESTHGLVESTHGLVESIHGLMESTHGLAESTHGLVESTHVSAATLKSPHPDS